MRSIRFAVLSNARKYVTERVVKNGRNDLFSVSLGKAQHNKMSLREKGDFTLLLIYLRELSIISINSKHSIAYVGDMDDLN